MSAFIYVCLNSHDYFAWIMFMLENAFIEWIQCDKVVFVLIKWKASKTSSSYRFILPYIFITSRWLRPHVWFLHAMHLTHFLKPFWSLQCHSYELLLEIMLYPLFLPCIPCPLVVLVSLALSTVCMRATKMPKEIREKEEILKYWITLKADGNYYNFDFFWDNSNKNVGIQKLLW